MKNITILAEDLSEQSLSAVLPTRGVTSVSVSRTDSATITSTTVGYAAFRNPNRFDPAYRIDLVVEDVTVDRVFENVSIAYGAGFFSDAEMWVEQPALALSA